MTSYFPLQILQENDRPKQEQTFWDDDFFFTLILVCVFWLSSLNKFRFVKRSELVGMILFSTFIGKFVTEPNSFGADVFFFLGGDKLFWF